LAGPIGKYPALSTELFSSLLEPAPGTIDQMMSGAGGTAIVSTSSGVTSSIHITLVLNGLFAPDEIADVPINIRLESMEKKQIILEDIQRVRKPNHDINVIEISSPVTAYDLRMLTRGRLTLTVESRKRPEALRLQGSVVTRVSCEIFQTLLSTHNPESQAKTSGLAWMFLNKEGALVYNIQTNNLNLQDNPLLMLIDESAKRKTELEDLTPSLVIDHAVGTLDRLAPKVLEPLYSGDLAINVATERDQSLIRGRLVTRPVADSRDSAAPVLLKRMDITAPSNFVGMAWVAVDSECNLHYEVTLAGVQHQYQPLQLFLEEIPIEAPGAPVSRRLLEEFSGNYLEGFVLGMLPSDLAKLETSVCYLEVRRKDRDEAVLKAELKSTKIPAHCFPQYTDNDVPKTPMTNEPNDNNLPTVDTKCYHSGRFYDDGESWRSSLENCTICSCMFARVKCEPIKCPPLKCNKDEIKHRKGECCPSCSCKYTLIINCMHNLYLLVLHC
jgi:chordin